MEFNPVRMARLAGISDSDDSTPCRLTESKEFTRDNLREFFGGEASDDTNEYSESDEPENEYMTEANFRRILSREIRNAIEELRKSKGKPIIAIKRKNRLI